MTATITLTMGAAVIYGSGRWLRGISDLVSLIHFGDPLCLGPLGPPLLLGPQGNPTVVSLVDYLWQLPLP